MTTTEIGLDLNRLREIIDRSEWTFAKTMPHMPHEYSFAGKGATQHDINVLTKAIREHGYRARWGKGKYDRYLAVDGWKYWGTGGRWINRAKIEHDTPEQQMARETWEQDLG